MRGKKGKKRTTKQPENNEQNDISIITLKYILASTVHQGYSRRHCISTFHYILTTTRILFSFNMRKRRLNICLIYGRHGVTNFEDQTINITCLPQKQYTVNHMMLYLII